ncbi:amino acid ABC transporter permease [Pseudovibrio brasiliensis]|uniref:Amino acid ABC transporter permease n=1 Tax=Pseudovibrio brasiliensis TaxID=1898042 RepID=A0ABX8AQQ4_9HYPH|nr:amino acid ABC transporter permease [Pseudovibrio brasiliensis]QUS56567.1 amino acid ABC transporter permease [Pseudovibrio brasiliensis]
MSAYSGLSWSDLLFLLDGASKTILLTALAALFGTVLGIALGWLRDSSRLVSWIVAPYVDVTRSVPLIIQFVLFNSFIAIAGYPLSPLWSGTIVLSSYMGVFTSEVVQAGLRAVRPELRRAGRSLGMGYWTEMRYVTAPLALRVVFPSWIGLVIGLTKDSALVGVIGYIELLRVSQILINRTNEAILILLGAGLFYFVICYPISRYSQTLERKLKQ